MKGDSLREFIAAVEQKGELRTVKGANPETDVGPISRLIQRTKPVPMVLFEQMKNTSQSFKILSHPLSSDFRTRWVFGVPPDLSGHDLVMEWKRRMDNYRGVPPVTTNNAPILENVITGNNVDLMKLPQPRWHEKDVRPYFGTHGAIITRDPDNGAVNMGVYRVSAYDKNTAGMHIAIGHHGQTNRDKYWERGEDCPVAIVLGAEPYVMAAASIDLPYDSTEYGWAGWVKGEPVEVVDGPTTKLPLPASGEAIVEGLIMRPEVEPAREEAPWGEGAGYYARGFPSPVVKVTAILHRNDSIIWGTNLGVPPDRSYPGSALRGEITNGTAWSRLEKAGLEDIKGIGHVGPWQVVSIHTRYPGHSRRVIDLMMSGTIASSRPPVYLIIVDEDINPSDPRDVWWALTSRCDPVNQVHIAKDTYFGVVPPIHWTKEGMDYPLEYGMIGSSLIIDATTPFRMKKDFGKIVGPVTPELEKRILEQFGEAMRMDATSKPKVAERTPTISSGPMNTM